MAQHDYVLDNQSGAEFRQDLNNALLAIVSQNSGATAPTTTYAYMLWADTANGQLKQRNAANTDWVVLQELDGTLLMENGSAAAPGLAFASDTNTGFYRPAADKLGISTGGTSRIVIDDSGQVLLGTTSGAWGSRAVIFGDTTLGTANPDVTFAYGSATPTDDTVLANINFTNSTNVTPGAVIRVAADGNWGSYQPSRIEFHVGSSSATADEAMRIDSEGRVGVGTSSPNELFNVATSSVSDTTLIRLDGGAGISQRFFPSSGTGKFNWQVAAQTNVDNGFEITPSSTSGGSTFSTPAVVVKSNGNVGIGTSSVTNSLHVVGTGDAVARLAATSDTNLTFSETTANKHWNIKPSAGDFYVQYSGTAYNSGYSSLVTIKNTGAVGIGTTSPAYRLDVNGTCRFTNGTNPYIALYNGSNTAYLQVASGDLNLVPPSSGNTTFNAGGSEAVRIDTSKRLLVGTSSATGDQLLVVQGYAGVSAGNAEFGLRRGGNPSAADQALGAITFQNSSGNSGARIEAVSAGSWTSGSNHRSYLTFSTTADGASSPTERFRIDSDGRFYFRTTNNDPAFNRVNGIYINQNSQLLCRIAGSTGWDLGSASSTPSHLNFYTDNGSARVTAGNISSNGATTTYNQTSDYRLKENVVALTGASERLSLLRPVNFDWKEGFGGTQPKGEGFIAHELQEVCPLAVQGEKDAVDDKGNPRFQGIDQSKLVPLLTAALQEAIGRIETLEAEVAALKGA